MHPHRLLFARIPIHPYDTRLIRKDTEIPMAETESILAKEIVRFVSTEGYQPRKLEDVARAMGIGRKEMGDFHDAVQALLKSGRIAQGSRQAIMLPEPPGRIIGQFRKNPRGFGFVIPNVPNAHGDLYIPPNKTGDAVTGDTVTAQVSKKGKRGGRMIYEGRIVNIVTRGRNRFVGELRKELKHWFVFPDGNTLHVPIVIADASAKGAREGDHVVVEITQYPEEHRDAQGVIVKVLGKRGEPGVDTAAIIEQYQFRADFPEAVVENARKVVKQHDGEREARAREDLRGALVITIDPVDARDFDDAISLTKARDGTYELGVHIADVAQFVRDGNPLDEEARERGTSVYLPGTVLPMLPEVLSNGLCSLQEGQPRLAKSAFITLAKRGKPRNVRFANTVIASQKRLTYEQAQAVLDGKPGNLDAKIVKLLRLMEELARVIEQRRRRDGMLGFDLPNVELVFDDNGEVVDVEPEDQSYTHKIIEMFMVEANEAVARLFASLDVPALRRIHDDPSPLSLQDLAKFLKLFGYSLPKNADANQLQTFLDSVKGQDDAFPVHLAVLRTMQRAEYSPERIGHYALASEHYCHFTSPIRRYPDLTVHRLLDLYIRGDLTARGGHDAVPDEKELISLGELCSQKERQAEAAEKELKLVKIIRLLEHRVGDIMEGVVTGVANIGVFVQLDKYLVDGLLRFQNLPEDWWEVDASRGFAEGERTGHRIRIGDRLKVSIVRTILPTRQIDLALAQKLETTDRKPRDTGRSEKGVHRRSKGKGKAKAPAKAKSRQSKSGRSKAKKPASAKRRQR